MARLPIISTPQPLRTDPILPRFAYESELWDDMANVLFEDSKTPNASMFAGEQHFGSSSSTMCCYVEVPCPVACRLHLNAVCQLGSAIGRADVSFYATILTPYIDFPTQLPSQVVQTFAATAFFPMPATTWVDVAPGVAQIITAFVIGAASPAIGNYSNTITVRRGRKP